MQMRALSHENDSELLSQVIGLAKEVAEAGDTVHFSDEIGDIHQRSFLERLKCSMAFSRMVVLGAVRDNSLLGSALLCLDRPPSQAHVARFHGLMVRRDLQKRGIGTALLSVAEVEARNLDRWLMLSEAVSGSPAARMLGKAGWDKVGDVPALMAMPQGGLAPATLYFKRLPNS